MLELELRAVRLAGLRDGLRRGCQELEQEASARHAELQALQSKRQRILDFRHLVVSAGSAGGNLGARAGQPLDVGPAWGVGRQ